MTTPTVRKCPRDGTDLVATKYEGSVSIDRCPNCGGAWLDGGELEQIQETIQTTHAEQITALQTVSNAINLAKQKQLPAVPCPVCATTMARKEYAYCSLILIDYCPQGHGIWLDRGELQALEQFFEQYRPDLTEKPRDHVQAGLWAAFWGTAR